MKRLHLCDGHDPNQVGIILRTLQQIWDTELWTRGRPTCELVLEHLHQSPVCSPGQFLNSGSLSEEEEKKVLQGNLDIYVKFHVWKNFPQLLFLVMHSHWKRSTWKMFWEICAYKCVIWKTEPLLKGRKKKKNTFFYQKNTKVPSPWVEGIEIYFLQFSIFYSRPLSLQLYTLDWEA